MAAMVRRERNQDLPMTEGCLEITCPCCAATIVIDARSGAVISHEAAQKPMRSLEEAAGEVARGKKRAEDRFSRAMSERGRQSEILDRKFRKAFEKAAEDDEPPKSPFDLE
jgi:hypothetical protein